MINYSRATLGEYFFANKICMTIYGMRQNQLKTGDIVQRHSLCVTTKPRYTLLYLIVRME